MKCSELMKQDVECARSDEVVSDVAQQMRSRNIGFLPVCDGNGTVVGTLTDRDLVLRVIAEQRDPGSTKASEVMTSDPVCCAPDDDITTAEERMSNYQKSRIICVDDQMHPVGVISLSDIAKKETSDRTARVLAAITEREARA